MHPRYVSYTLGQTKDDVVAQYMASSLNCAAITSKGERLADDSKVESFPTAVGGSNSQQVGSSSREG